MLTLSMLLESQILPQTLRSGWDGFAGCGPPLSPPHISVCSNIT